VTRWFYAFIAVIFVGAIAVSLAADFVVRPAGMTSGVAEFNVVIDAGHGGRDGGASSPSGVKESDINLAIAKYLASELDSRGVGVVMTRTNTASLANPLARNQKKSDMDARRKIIEKATPDLVISIHLNSLPSYPAVRGLQVFFDKTGDLSKIYAQAIQDNVNASNLYTYRRASTGDYYILNCTAYPSVLVECGFLSNPSDVALLVNPEYQKMLAQLIAEGILSV